MPPVEYLLDLIQCNSVSRGRGLLVTPSVSYCVNHRCFELVPIRRDIGTHSASPFNCRHILAIRQRILTKHLTRISKYVPSSFTDYILPVTTSSKWRHKPLDTGFTFVFAKSVLYLDSACCNNYCTVIYKLCITVIRILLCLRYTQYWLHIFTRHVDYYERPLR